MVMQKRARLIYNPTAGREQIRQYLPEILSVYEEAGYETSTFKTKPTPLSALHEASRAADAGFDLIIAAGGDGTVSEVISGVAEKKHRPLIAVIPAGTANDLATALHIPTDSMIAAARVIEKNHTVPMDIGKLKNNDQTKFFMNVAAMGSLTEVTYEVSQQMKTVLGYLAYVLKGAQMLPNIASTPVKIRYEGGEYEGPASFVFIALTSTIGGFEGVVPGKVIGDGKFTLIIIKPSNLIELLDLLRLIYRDKSKINHESIVYQKTSWVEVENLAQKPMRINLDGEYGGDAPAYFENIQQHIRFVADAKNVDTMSNGYSAFEQEMIEELVNQDQENAD